VKVKESNLYFIAMFIILGLVLGGLSIVDAGLTRLIMPEAPFVSVSIKYSHGMTLVVPDKQYHVPCIELCTVSIEDSYWHFARGGGEVKLPRLLIFGDIEKLRSWLDVDKLSP
jgi:hypothetical protein